MSKIWIVEGEIGAGKTELIKALSGHFRENGQNVCAVFEPVDEWRETGALNKFYTTPHFELSFQMYAMATRINHINNAMKANPEADIYILERSPATDKIFWKLQNVDNVDKKMYDSFAECLEKMIPFDIKTTKIIYLKPDIDLCMQRISERNRHEEKDLSRDYQMRLRAAHEEYLTLLPNVHTIGNEIASLDWRSDSPNREFAIKRILQILE